MPQNTVLRADGLCVQFHDRTVLNDVSLALTANSITTIIGPNGGGKSTLIRVLLGLLRPERGHIQKKPDLRIGYMPQKLDINAQLPLNVLDFLRLSRGARSNSIEHWLGELNIQHLQHASIHTLSGGEWQRVLLARALLVQPELLVMDEPAQGIDVQGQAELYARIPELAQQLHCAVLMVSHDLHLVMQSTDHVICLNGHICCEGHPDKISRNPNYHSLFPNMAAYTHHHDHTHPENTMNRSGQPHV